MRGYASTPRLFRGRASPDLFVDHRQRIEFFEDLQLQLCGSLLGKGGHNTFRTIDDALGLVKATTRTSTVAVGQQCKLHTQAREVTTCKSSVGTDRPRAPRPADLLSAVLQQPVEEQCPVVQICVRALLVEDVGQDSPEHFLALRRSVRQMGGCTWSSACDARRNVGQLDAATPLPRGPLLVRWEAERATREGKHTHRLKKSFIVAVSNSSFTTVDPSSAKDSTTDSRM